MNVMNVMICTCNMYTYTHTHTCMSVCIYDM